jgi:hypothetical protein
MEALDFPETRSIFPLENVLLKSRKLWLIEFFADVLFSFFN